MRKKRYTLENCKELFEYIFETAEIGKSKLRGDKHYFEVNIVFDYLQTDIYEGLKCIANIPYLFAISFYLPKEDKSYQVYCRSFKELLTLFSTLNEVANTINKKQKAPCNFAIYTTDLSIKRVILSNIIKFNSKKVIKGEKTTYACYNYIEFRDMLVYLDSADETLFDNPPEYDKTVIRTPESKLLPDSYRYIKYRLDVLHREVESAKASWYNKISIIRDTRVSIVNLRMKSFCYNNYQNISNKILPIRSTDEYKILRNVIGGGFIGYNPKYINKSIDNVLSADITSSYPAVIFGSDKFPISYAGLVARLYLEDYLNLAKTKYIESYITFKLKAKYDFHYLKKSNIYIDNEDNKFDLDDNLIEGTVTICCTSYDFYTISLFYKIEGFVSDFNYTYNQGYLPKPIRECLISFYVEKTRYKGDIANSFAYLIAKVATNTIYGNMLRDPFRYDKFDKTDDLVLRAAINNYNENISYKKETSCYQWGVAIASIARYRIAQLVRDGIELDCWLYTDTDSLKFKYNKEFLSYIDNFNNMIYDLHSKFNNSSKLSDWICMSNTGDYKYLGLFEIEDCYRKFKVLGKKQYILINSYGNFEAHCSGISERVIVEYKNNNYKGDEDFIERFGQGDIIKNATNGASRNLDNQDLVVKDYEGKEYSHKLKAGIWTPKLSYRFGVSDIKRIAEAIAGGIEDEQL